jgi:hypothetical protein
MDLKKKKKSSQVKYLIIKPGTFLVDDLQFPIGLLPNHHIYRQAIGFKLG